MPISPPQRPPCPLGPLRVCRQSGLCTCPLGNNLPASGSIEIKEGRTRWHKYPRIFVVVRAERPGPRPPPHAAVRVPRRGPARTRSGPAGGRPPGTPREGGAPRTASRQGQLSLAPSRSPPVRALPGHGAGLGTGLGTGGRCPPPPARPPQNNGGCGAPRPRQGAPARPRRTMRPGRGRGGCAGSDPHPLLPAPPVPGR